MEHWEIKDGFISNGRWFFDIDKCSGFFKIGDKGLRAAFYGCQVDTEFNDTESRDEIFNMFCSWKRESRIEHLKELKEHQEYHHNYQEAALAIQKRIIGDNVNIVK